MKGVGSFADDNADLASANRRNFLMQAGTTAGILAAGMVLVWDAFLHYAKSRPGVAFLRKDEIARFALQSPLTLRESETI